ncbi:hypothetical protein T484DRAFT_1826195 [Baffinella frigidus]|nr:hypothetical protein T484DRAFT_1826195 [Cryptophyta sp. CCMP2293]
MQKIMRFVTSSASGKPRRKSLGDHLDQPPARGERMESSSPTARTRGIVQKRFVAMMEVAARGDDESFAAYLEGLSLSLRRTADASHHSNTTASLHNNDSPCKAQTDVSPSRAQTADTRHRLPFFPQESSATRTEDWLTFSANLDQDVVYETPAFWDSPQQLPRTPERLPIPRTPEPRPKLRSSLRSAPTRIRAASREMKYQEQGMRSWASAPGVLTMRVSFSASEHVCIIPALDAKQ